MVSLDLSIAECALVHQLLSPLAAQVRSDVALREIDGRHISPALLRERDLICELHETLTAVVTVAAGRPHQNVVEVLPPDHNPVEEAGWMPLTPQARPALALRLRAAMAIEIEVTIPA